MEFSRTIDLICWSCFFVLCFMSHRSHYLLFLHGVQVSQHTHLHTHVEIRVAFHVGSGHFFGISTSLFPNLSDPISNT